MMIAKYQIHGTPLLVSDKIKINGNLYDFPNDDFKALYTAIIYKMRDQEAALTEARKGLEFYGKEHNWYTHNGTNEYSLINPADKEEITIKEMFWFSKGVEEYQRKLGGKTARAAIAKIEELLKTEKK